ncbi:MAG: STAS domain-containing protein [Planctomycetes bacterium]|nr:STAS domain-containing protein [Planctomycetota bacterium]
MNKYAVIRPEEIVNQDECARFGLEIDQAIASGVKIIVVDCEDVRYINSSAIGKIVEAYMELSEIGGAVRIVKAGDFVRRGFDSVGILSFIELCDSLDDAIERGL